MGFRPASVRAVSALYTHLLKIWAAISLCRILICRLQSGFPMHCSGPGSKHIGDRPGRHGALFYLSDLGALKEAGITAYSVDPERILAMPAKRGH